MTDEATSQVKLWQCKAEIIPFSEIQSPPKIKDL